MEDGIYFKTVLVKNGKPIEMPLRSITGMVGVLAPFLLEVITTIGIKGEDKAVECLKVIEEECVL